MAIKGIDIAAGMIYPDYRGELKVIMVNSGPKTYVVTQGSRIAQIILERIVTNAEVEIVSSLPATGRGTNGFGHTDADAYLRCDDLLGGSTATPSTPSHSPQ